MGNSKDYNGYKNILQKTCSSKIKRNLISFSDKEVTHKQSMTLFFKSYF